MTNAKIVTVRLGGPNNPVLVQGEFCGEENSLTFVKLSDSVVVRGKLIPSVRIDDEASSSV